MDRKNRRDRKLTSAEKTKLIRLYRSNPLLWDIQNKYYRQSELKVRAYEDIANKMGLSVNNVKSKLRALRSTYTGEKRKMIEQKSGFANGEDSYVPSLSWFKEMSFLDGSIIARKACEIPKRTNRVFSEKKDNKEFIAFGSCVAHQLRKMPQEDAYELMGEMQSLLTERKLKKLPQRRHLPLPTEKMETTTRSSTHMEEEYIETDIKLLDPQQYESVYQNPEPNMNEGSVEEFYADPEISDNAMEYITEVAESELDEEQPDEEIIEEWNPHNESGENSTPSTSPTQEPSEDHQPPRRKKKIWVKPLLIRRSDHDIEAVLLNDLYLEDDEENFNGLQKVNIDMFEEIHSLVYSSLKKTDTCMRAALTPRTKLAITLRYLASGDSMRSLEFVTRVSKTTIGLFLPQVLRAIYDALKPCLKFPDTEDEWKEVADDFENLWQFPHTLGAMDAKHIRIKAPSNNASHFYRFKGFFSIVLFALVDAHSRFAFVDVVYNNKNSDCSVFKDSYICNALETGLLRLPDDVQLVEGQVNKMPYYFVANDQFPLVRNIMKPYKRSLKLNIQQEIYNCRLDRARLSVEHAFSRLAKRFKVFERPIDVQLSTVELVITTCCVLHNYFTKPKPAPMPEDFMPDSLPNTFSPIDMQDYEPNNYATHYRNELSQYLIGDGNVDFQWDRLGAMSF